MALDVKHFTNSLYFILILFLSTQSNAQNAEEALTELPKLSTKQAIRNLRFVSFDGRFTYYQRRNGSLLLSQNFTVTEVLSGEIGTQYSLYSSPSKKAILIEQNLNFHDNLNIKAANKVYTVSYGKDVPTYRGEGLASRLHLDDTWLSYYVTSTKEILFQSFSAEALNFKIKLKNIKNSFFVPQAFMIDSDKVVHTDLNEIGIPAVIVSHRKTEQVDILLRGDAADQKMELCLNETHLFVLEAGINSSSLGTKLYRYPKNDFSTAKRQTIYQSQRNDIGNLVCDVDEKLIYFIKNTSSTYDVSTFEVAQLNLENEKVQELTNLRYVTQIVNLDGRLLIPYRGIYYVLRGESDLTLDDRLAPIPKKEKGSGNE